MVKSKKDIVWGIVLCIFCGIFYFLGSIWAQNEKLVLDEKKVALRVEMRKEELNFNQYSMLKFLEEKYESNGYKVYEPAYYGDLYPLRLRDAGVNIFIRGKFISLDKRYIDEAYNIYLVDSYVDGKIVEFRNFDEYWATRKELVESANSFGVKMSEFRAQNFKKKNIDRTNASEILYIYEGKNGAIGDRLVRENNNAKLYSSVMLAGLSENERDNILAKAKVVVYDCMEEGVWDKFYSYLFGVYNLLSYGGAVIVNESCGKVGDIDGVKVFSNYEEMRGMLRLFMH